MSADKYSPDIYRKYKKAKNIAETIDVKNPYNRTEEKREFLISLGIRKIKGNTLGSERVSSSMLNNRVIQALKRLDSYMKCYQARFEQDEREGRLPPDNNGEQREFEFRGSIQVGASQVPRGNYVDNEKRQYLAMRRR